MELNEETARIFLDPNTKQILDINICETSLRFGCRRCAIFCCKLGGPKLTKKDIQRIEQDGYSAKEFFVPFKGRSNSSSTFQGMLKSREDGSCVFLEFDPERGDYECSIYDYRPALCRLYPFDLEKIDSKSIVLRLIPCCRGLNNPDGELVDERFIVSHMLDSIFDLTF